jgi:hypothetical protein
MGHRLNDLFLWTRAWSVVCFLVLLIVNSSTSTQEFQVFRMQQYDMPSGTHFGSQANQISMEARNINAKANSVSRKCVLAKLGDFNLERYRILVGQYVGAIIVLLPEKYNEINKKTMKDLESQLLHEEVKIPVYFIVESVEINQYYDLIESERTNQADISAFQKMIDSVVTNGFQFVINSAQSRPIVHSSYEFQPINIQGKLNGGLLSIKGSESIGNTDFDSGESIDSQKVSTIIITAHYDTFGMATVNMN